MKYLVLPAVIGHIMVGAAAVATPPPPATAQDIKWVPGKRLVESSVQVMGAMQAINKQTEYGFDRDICLLAGFLLKGQNLTFVRHFDTDEKYAVVGGGDDGVKDLDIVILDARSDAEIVSDTRVNSTATVEFKVPRAGLYRIKVVMADARDNGGFATIGILRKNGYEVPDKNLGAALGNIVVECLRVDNATEKRVLFSSGNNQWAVYGMILKQGETLTMSGLTPGGGSRVWVTGGDDAAQDLDLYLLDGDGDVIAKDEDDDARPFLSRITKANLQYGFRVKNVKSKGPSFVLTGVLAIGD